MYWKLEKPAEDALICHPLVAPSYLNPHSVAFSVGETTHAFSGPSTAWQLLPQQAVPLQSQTSPPPPVDFSFLYNLLVPTLLRRLARVKNTKGRRLQRVVFGSRPLTGSLVLGMVHPRLLIVRRAVAFAWHRTNPPGFQMTLKYVRFSPRGFFSSLMES